MCFQLKARDNTYFVWGHRWGVRPIVERGRGEKDSKTDYQDSRATYPIFHCEQRDLSTRVAEILYSKTCRKEAR
jgi:hypothetical protein